MVLRTLAVSTLAGTAIVVQQWSETTNDKARFKGRLPLPTDVTSSIFRYVERAKTDLFNEYSNRGGYFHGMVSKIDF